MAKLTLARALVTLVFRFRKIEKKPHLLSSFSQGTGLGFAEDGNIGNLPDGRSWIRFLSVFFWLAHFAARFCELLGRGDLDGTIFA